MEEQIWERVQLYRLEAREWGRAAPPELTQKGNEQDTSFRSQKKGITPSNWTN